MSSQRILRTLFQRWWRWQRALTLGVRGIVLDDQNRVLLIQQTYSSGWIFPGGGVEFGETLETALSRELREETGVEMSDRAELMGVYSNAAVFPGDHVAIYVIRRWRRAHAFVPNYEIKAAEFFPLDDLPPDTTGGTRRRLEELRNDAPKSETW